MDKRKIGVFRLILGTILFVGGVAGYITGQLPAEQIQGIGAMAHSPLVSAIISIGILSYIAIWKIFNKRQIGEVLLILGTILFVGGAVGYITGQLPAEQIPGIGALALILTGGGAGMKKMKP